MIRPKVCFFTSFCKVFNSNIFLIVTLDPSSFRSGLKSAAERKPDANAPKAPSSGSSKPALARSHTVGGGEGFRRGGAAAGPGRQI